MTKQTTWDGKEVLLCEVPEDAGDFALHEIDEFTKVVFSSKTNDPAKCGGDMIRTPTGSYRFAFASPLSPTEAEAGEWVEKVYQYESVDRGLIQKEFLGFVDYEEVCWLEKTALASIASRYRSEGFQHPERTILLIKQK